MDRPTGYEPLYTLKSVAPDLWIADGGWIRFYGIPFPTRMTVIRLSDGGIWVHSLPRDIATTFRRHPDHIRKLVSDLIAWGPERVILAHGRWYQENATAELKRAFRHYLAQSSGRQPRPAG